MRAGNRRRGMNLQLRVSRIAPLLCVAALLTFTGASGAAREEAVPLRGWDKKIDKMIGRDSQRWLFNRYDYGSVRNARRRATSDDGHTIIVAADYTYNNGIDGYVNIVVTDGEVTCIEYWDKPGACASYMPAELNALRSSPGGGNYSSSDSSGCDMGCQSDRQREYQNQNGQ